MADKIYSVTELTKAIKRNLLQNNPKIAGVWFEGEISGFKLYSSGHRYFSLKDSDALIDCVLFSFRVDGCDAAFRARIAQGDAAVNGLKVQIQGELDITMSRGRYSFKVLRVRLAGLGDRMAELQALKTRLEAEGLNKLNHPEKRRALPFLPRRIGIVTSGAGAVIHDMCDVITRRFANVEVRLYPAKVQGDGAAESLVEGIQYFNSRFEDGSWRADVLIVARGGGSTEDLWAFNEEPLVRSVALSRIPVISAVGHESDVTLCDYVADQRAGTPSIGAAFAVPDKTELTAKIEQLRARLQHALYGVVEGGIQRLDHLSRRMAAAPQLALTRLEQRLQNCALRLEPPLRGALQRAEYTLKQQQRSLELLNPYKVLERGYSITIGEDGKVLRNADEVRKGMRLKTRLEKGEIESVAT